MNDLNSKGFALDQRLQNDCHPMGVIDDIEILLMNNSLLPWFILVPRVQVTEIHQLLPAQRSALYLLQDQISGFLVDTFSPDKLNVAAIGNVVSQLHLHVLGRFTDDYCWPGVVWGRPEKKLYTPARLAEIEQQLSDYLKTKGIKG